MRKDPTSLTSITTSDGFGGRHDAQIGQNQASQSLPEEEICLIQVQQLIHGVLQTLEKMSFMGKESSTLRCANYRTLYRAADLWHKIIRALPIPIIYRLSDGSLKKLGLLTRK